MEVLIPQTDQCTENFGLKRALFRGKFWCLSMHNFINKWNYELNLLHTMSVQCRKFRKFFHCSTVPIAKFRTTQILAVKIWNWVILDFLNYGMFYWLYCLTYHSDGVESFIKFSLTLNCLPQHLLTKMWSTSHVDVKKAKSSLLSLAVISLERQKCLCIWLILPIF